MTPPHRVVAAGDSALLVEFEERIDPAINVRVIRLADAIERAAIAGVRDVVPTFRSVAVFFDPLRTNLETLSRRLEREALHLEDGSAEPRPPIDVPLCYGGDYGPDLPEVAHLAHMAMEEVVAAHSAVTYRVFMLGFVPGFPYMGLVDPRIAVPRRAIPRIRVPRGSVGIAGRQTGIYPVETPGGWQLIGRTPIGLFDARRQPPSFFRPGDSVRFYPVDEMEFHRSWSPPLGGLSSR